MIITYPAVGAANTRIVTGAAPDRTAGPFPLVIFSEGFDIPVTSYATLTQSWTRAGFVVVEPVYPFTDPSYTTHLNESDIINHPRDLSFVISSILALNVGSTTTLAGLVNPREIIVAGQSDGGDVALATVANTCCRDSRIRAAMILSGAELSSFAGQYFQSPTVPMLVTQGTNDIINPEACSVQIYNAANAPKYYLSLFGASHLAPYVYPGPYRDIVVNVTTEFLKDVTSGSGNSFQNLTAQGTVPGISALTTGGSVGPIGGSCPGAPTQTSSAVG